MSTTIQLLVTLAIIFLGQASSASAVDLSQLKVTVLSVSRVPEPVKSCLGTALRGGNAPCPSGTLVSLLIANDTPFALRKIDVACTTFDARGQRLNSKEATTPSDDGSAVRLATDRAEQQVVRSRDTDVAALWFPLDPQVEVVRCRVIGASQ